MNLQTMPEYHRAREWISSSTCSAAEDELPEEGTAATKRALRETPCAPSCTSSSNVLCVSRECACVCLSPSPHIHMHTHMHTHTHSLSLSLSLDPPSRGFPPPTPLRDRPHTRGVHTHNRSPPVEGREAQAEGGHRRPVAAKGLEAHAPLLLRGFRGCRASWRRRRRHGCNRDERNRGAERGPHTV